MGADDQVSDAVLTIPNLVSALRLTLVPVFVWLFLIDSDALALGLLFIVGSSDWVDGYLARRLHQISRLGQILDPIADRIAIVAALVVLVIEGIIWLPVAVAILARDIAVALAFFVLQSRGLPRPEVNAVGKWATFLIYTGAGLVLGSLVLPGPTVWSGAGHGLLIIGAVLYWAAALMYLRDVQSAARRV